MIENVLNERNHVILVLNDMLKSKSEKVKIQSCKGLINIFGLIGTRILSDQERSSLLKVLDSSLIITTSILASNITTRKKHIYSIINI